MDDQRVELTAEVKIQRYFTGRLTPTTSFPYRFDVDKSYTY